MTISKNEKQEAKQNILQTWFEKAVIANHKKHKLYFVVQIK